MTSCAADENIDSEPSSSPNSFPINSLHEHVKLEILKQLKFEDYCNLAFTCKLWYQTAVSAPLSVKPDVHFDSLDMDDGFYLNKHDNGNLDHNVLSFQLVNKVKCENLIISTGICIDLQRFILFNRSHFEFHNILVELGDMDEEDYVFMEPLFDMAPGIEWKCGWTNEKFLLRFVENHLSHRNIIIWRSKKTESFSIVLKQWTEGKRPSMEYLLYSNRKPIEWQEFTRGIEEFVQNRHIDGNDHFSARIVVSGLPEFIISGYIIHLRNNGDQTISLKRAQSSKS